jgi:predicted RNase H-like HicB family nuclease
MNDPDRYPAEVFWSDEDEGFIAIAPDLPGCSAFGESEAEALAELKHAIAAWKEAATNAGNPVPPPSRPASAASYSGKFVVRMPKTMHRQLAQSAEKEGVSLNQYLITLLATYNGLSAVDVVLQSVRSSGAVLTKVEHARYVQTQGVHSIDLKKQVLSSGAGTTTLAIQQGHALWAGANYLPAMVNEPIRRLPFSPTYVSEALDG